MNTPWFLVCLATAYAELGQFDEAWRCIDEAMSMVATTKETGREAEVNRIAGEISLKSPSRTRRKRKLISSVRSQSRVSSKQSPGNSAPR